MHMRIIYMHICSCANICTHTCDTHVHTCTSIDMYIHLYTCTNLCTYIYVHIFTCEICMLRMHMHVHVHLRLCIAYRHMCTPMLSLHTWYTCENVFTCSWWKCLPLWPGCLPLALIVGLGLQPGKDMAPGPTLHCKFLAENQKWRYGGLGLVSFPPSRRQEMRL